MVATIDNDTSPELYPALPIVADKIGRKRQRCVVRFDNTVTHQVTYSKEDVKDFCWYSDREYQAIKEDVLETVELMRQNVPIDDENYCRRGLEWFEKENNEKHAAVEKLKQPVRVVIDMQAMGQRSFQDSATLADSMAQRYGQESQHYKMTAYLTGIADERNAKSIARIQVAMFADQLAVPPTNHNNKKGASRLGLPPRSPPRRVTLTADHAT